MQREKAKICGPRLRLDDGLDGCGVGWRDDRHAGLDAVHAGFRQTFGDADFVVHGHDDAGLLLAVAQRDVVHFDVLGELEILDHFLRVIPLADVPVVRLPRCFAGHLVAP